MNDPATEIRNRCMRDMREELVRLDREPGESTVYLNRLLCTTREYARLISINDKVIKRENVQKFAVAFLRAAGLRAGVLGNLNGAELVH